MNKSILFIALFFIATSCNEKKPTSVISAKVLDTPLIAKANSKDSFNTNDIKYFADTVVHIRREILEHYFRKYHKPSCNSVNVAKSDFNDFEGFHVVGDINNDHKPDSVFLLPYFNYCEDKNGISFGNNIYYFTDTTLPRLASGAECCHPENIFSVGDIDEDGILEIGQYFSACSSHYKSLRVWSLKNSEWVQVGSSVFDQRYMSYKLPFRHYIRKTGKGKFEMLEITDLTDDRSKIGKKNWKKFSM